MVITNLDRYSPPEYVHMQNLIDITQCDELPSDPMVLKSLAVGCHVDGPRTPVATADRSAPAGPGH